MSEETIEELLSSLEETGFLTQRELKIVVTIIRYLIDKVTVLESRQHDRSGEADER